MWNPFKAVKDWFNEPVNLELPYYPKTLAPIEGSDEEAAQDMETCIRKALIALGNTLTTVAEKLISMGVKGKRGDPLLCPVAQYINLTCKTQGLSSSSTIRVGWADSHNYVNLRVSNPQAVRDFIASFDHGTAPHQKELEG